MKKVVSIVLTFILLYISAVSAVASSNNINELKNQMQETEAELEAIQEEQESVESEVEELRAQISKYETEIEELNDKIEELENSISEKEEEIEQLEEETKEKQDLLIARLVAMYERGQTNYLDVLLSSEDITSLISNYYRIEELASADQSVIDSIIEKQEETEAAKQELEEEKAEIDEAKQELEIKNETLQTAKAEKEEKMASLSEEEQELQNTLDEFEAAIKKAEEEIEKTTSSVGSYEGSFKGVLEWPLSYSYNIITSIFGNRTAPTAGASSNHGAIDIAVSYVSVYAPADGKVIYAGWSRWLWELCKN